MLPVQKGDFCCFPFSNCAFPGTRRSTEHPGGSPRDQEISSETRRSSQGLGDSPRTQDILPGPRRSSQDPRDSPGVQEILLGPRRSSQDPGDPSRRSSLPGVQENPRTKIPAQHLFLLCSSFPTSLQTNPDPFPISQDGGSLCAPSHQGNLGFSSITCPGRAELAPCHRVPVTL